MERVVKFVGVER